MLVACQPALPFSLTFSSILSLCWKFAPHTAVVRCLAIVYWGRLGKFPVALHRLVPDVATLISRTFYRFDTVQATFQLHREREREAEGRKTDFVCLLSSLPLNDLYKAKYRTKCNRSNRTTTEAPLSAILSKRFNQLCKRNVIQFEVVKTFLISLVLYFWLIEVC